MNSADRTLFEPKAVSHPGETVLEYLEFHGWSQRDLARRTGITPKTIRPSMMSVVVTGRLMKSSEMFMAPPVATRRP